jgi:hypothetical protein
VRVGADYYRIVGLMRETSDGKMQPNGAIGG